MNLWALAHLAVLGIRLFGAAVAVVAIIICLFLNLEVESYELFPTLPNFGAVNAE